MMADTCTAQPNSNRHSTNNDVTTPSKRLPQHKVEPSTSSGEKVGGNLSIACCTDPCSCMTLYDVLKSFNAPVSEEQMWALIFQSVKLYRDALQHSEYNLKDLRAPVSTHNLNIHKDGSVHVSFNSNDPGDTLSSTSQKQILFQIDLVVYEACDYNLSENNAVSMSFDLEQLISKMTQEDVDDEGIERDSDDIDDYKSRHTKDLDHILDFCTPRVQPTNPNEHYKAVCRALATETCELRAFLQTVYHGETDHLRLKADVETSKLELQKLEFSDWIIASRNGQKKTVCQKSCDMDLLTETDQEVEKLLMSNLSSEFPTHRFIGEEETSEGKKADLTDLPTWIIDPVDGTMNFVHSFPHSCISVALLVNKTPQLGIIYNPILNQKFTAIKDEGAFLNGIKIHVSGQTDLGKALFTTEFGTSRDTERLNVTMENIRKIAESAHGIRALGSAALNMAMVALGAADCNYEVGIHAWDIAAGDLIVREAGGFTCDPTGQPLDFMARRILAASSPELAHKVANLLTQFYPPRD